MRITTSFYLKKLLKVFRWKKRRFRGLPKELRKFFTLENNSRKLGIENFQHWDNPRVENFSTLENNPRKFAHCQNSVELCQLMCLSIKNGQFPEIIFIHYK